MWQAKKVYNVSRFMEIASQLRKDEPGLDTIYVCADEFDFPKSRAGLRRERTLTSELTCDTVRVVFLAWLTN